MALGFVNQTSPQRCSNHFFKTFHFRHPKIEIAKDKPQTLPRFRVATTGRGGGIKKLPHLQRAGRGVGQVLQQYLFTSTAKDEKHIIY
jgi:hypothetical protein